MLANLTNREIQEHKLEGYLFHFNGETLTDQQREHYAKTWKKQWYQNQEKLQFLTLLDQSGLKVTVLKGAAFLANLYRDGGSRFLSDIDLLVSPEVKKELIRFLQSQRFGPITEESKWMGNDYKCSFRRGIIIVEIHTQLLFHKKLEIITKPLDEYSHLNALASEDNFVYLSGHLALQHNFHKLYWLMDLYQLVTQVEIDWNRVEELANRFHLKQSVRSVASLLNNQFNLSIPLQKPRPLILPLLQKKSGWRYYLLKHLLKDSLWSAIWYDLCWFFSKGKKRRSKEERIDESVDFDQMLYRKKEKQSLF